jgi:hypothetical protein
LDIDSVKTWKTYFPESTGQILLPPPRVKVLDEQVAPVLKT